MTLVIGIDEAGYGPNLGPLVVAASVWRLEDDGDAPDPEEAGARLARAAAAVATAAGLARIPWADSKKLHTPGAGLAPLERGVLAAVGTVGGGRAGPVDGAGLAERLDIGADGAPAEWSRFLGTRLPADADPGDVERLRAAIGSELPRQGVALAALAARVVHPLGFNRLLDDGLNKSDILSRLSLELAAGLRAARSGEPALVWCDRHGGRKAYAPLVGRHFDTPLVRTLGESPEKSRYQVGGPGAAGTWIDFTVGGEERVPVALASMTAKYVRELAMRAFNDHWGALLPGLVPTAGYPVDARRWLDAARDTVEAAGLPVGALWRRA